MNRRDVLRLGAVAAGAGAGVPGCVLPRPVAEMTGPDGAAAFTAMLDEQLAAIEGPGVLQRLAMAESKRPLSPEAHAKLAEKDGIFRRLLGTVLVTQAFRELPEETREHPDVQLRMWKELDGINDSIYEITDMLANLDANERKRLRTKLHERPDLPMEIGEHLDARAARAGLSSARRRQLRHMMSSTSFRLKTTDPSSIIDEYVEKVDKLRESSARDAAALAAAARLGEREFWRQQRLRMDDDSTAAPAPAPPSPPPAGPAPSPAPVVDPAPAPTTELPIETPPTTVGPPPRRVSPIRSAELLMMAARRAALHGNCTTVKLIGQRVRELNTAYYVDVFEPDPVIAACREGVNVDDASVRPGHSGEQGLRTGSYLLGLGLVINLISLPLVLIFIGLFGLTVGVILMGIGILVLYVSALAYVLTD